MEWPRPPFQAIVEGVKESHSPSPEGNGRNSEYLISRAALGGNPAQEKMDKAVEYSLQQHKN